jgi:hypothetical protein
MRIGIRFGLFLLLWPIAGTHLLRAVSKPHIVFLGSSKNVPYSIAGDPAGALPDEKQLRVRPLMVDGKLKEWTNELCVSMTPFPVTRLNIGYGSGDRGLWSIE